MVWPRAPDLLCVQPCLSVLSLMAVDPSATICSGEVTLGRHSWMCNGSAFGGGDFIAFKWCSSDQIYRMVELPFSLRDIDLPSN